MSTCALMVGLMAYPAAGLARAASLPRDAPTSGGLAAAPVAAPPPRPTGQPGAGGAPVTATFGIGPATSGAQERPYFNYLVSPGAGASDAVALVNLATTPVTLTVYPSDIVNAADGTSSAPPASAKLVDSGAWISLKAPNNTVTVTVAPRSTSVLPVAFSVPFSASPGDHVAGIIASLQSFAKNAQGDLVRLDQRVLTRVFFRVSGALTPKLSVDGLSASYQQNYTGLKGSVTLNYTVSNRGNVKLAVHQLADFTTLLGTKYSAPGLADFPVLLPGASGHVTVRIPGALPELVGTAHVKLVPSGVGQDSDPGLVSVTASTRVWTPPLVALAVLIVVVGLIVLLRRRKKWQPSSGAPTQLASPARPTGPAPQAARR